MIGTEKIQEEDETKKKQTDWNIDTEGKNCTLMCQLRGETGDFCVVVVIKMDNWNNQKWTVPVFGTLFGMKK